MEALLEKIEEVRLLKLAESRVESFDPETAAKGGNNLTGFFKIKYRDIGIRVVFTLVRDQEIMNITGVSERDDDYCYELAAKLYKKYGDSIFDVSLKKSKNYKYDETAFRLFFCWR